MKYSTKNIAFCGIQPFSNLLSEAKTVHVPGSMRIKHLWTNIPSTGVMPLPVSPRTKAPGCTCLLLFIRTFNQITDRKQTGRASPWHITSQSARKTTPRPDSPHFNKRGQERKNVGNGMRSWNPSPVGLNQQFLPGNWAVFFGLKTQLPAWESLPRSELHADPQQHCRSQEKLAPSQGKGSD